MSLIDVAIPGAIGLLLLLWPQAMFLGAATRPDPGRIRILRLAGGLLVGAALVYLAIAGLGG